MELGRVLTRDRTGEMSLGEGYYTNIVRYILKR